MMNDAAQNFLTIQQQPSPMRVHDADEDDLPTATYSVNFPKVEDGTRERLEYDITLQPGEVNFEAKLRRKVDGEYQPFLREVRYNAILDSEWPIIERICIETDLIEESVEELVGA
jgi:hypothetical protein